MKKSLIFIVLIFFTQLSAKGNLEKVKQAIEQKNVQWQAGENSISRLSKEEFRKLLGSPVHDIPLSAEEKFIQLTQTGPLPASLDWRNNNGNWMTSVKNQGGCGSCWDFSAVAQIESWWKIYYDLPDSNINLSEQYILSCGSEAGSCDGGWANEALEFVKNNSIPHEIFMPYKADDQVACGSIIAGWESTSVTIPGWGYITLEEENVINIKNALMYHPVSANYSVYEDFAYYNGGVYEHVWGELEAGHAILIIGWEDENECWICKNSWGPYWGENGYFRIKWGSCDIGQYIPFIYDEIVDNAQIAFSQENVSVSLAAGATSSTLITVTNNSTLPLQLFTTDSQDPVIFHQSSRNAYSGKNWWCGTKELGGYGNHWLQYLETPVIDLSSASNPELNFMAKWSIESPDYAEAPYDGWDGWNVWFSTDGGENYTLMEPQYPEYTSNALWAFGHPEQGWNMGTSVKGWAGASPHWVPVKFDLSAFAGQTLKIRFAFASDMGYSSADDESLEGVFIDDISLSDNSIVLFSDNADQPTQLIASGFGDLPNDWLTLTYDSNQLAAGESMELHLDFSAPEKVGNYTGKIQFLANNENQTLPSIPVHLLVSQPENDIAIDGFLSVDKQINLDLLYAIGVLVSNNGTTEKTNIPIVLSNSTGELNETQVISQLAPGQTTTLWFESHGFANLAETQIIASATGSDDINPNNSDSITIHVTEMVDSFEKYNPFWKLDENSSFTVHYPADGQYALALTGNSNNCATYNNPIGIGSKNYYLGFFATTTGNPARLFLEFSYDQTNWTEADTFDVVSQTYSDYFHGKNFAQNMEKVWFRIRAENSPGSAVYVDDLFLISEATTGIGPDEKTAFGFQLRQNYPNPFNPTTVIEYQIPKNSAVSLKIFDVSGKLVETLVNENQPGGTYKIQWDASHFPSGIYFYKLVTEGHSGTHKMILMK
ncbi:MAG: T9SS type A sorting domain-containing protein [Candidatus Marinimicrobia bacterium]|nr:T9SS type A sorting domain-containing protein [Candidatus Neomarinimicrobiota bacterium]